MIGDSVTRGFDCSSTNNDPSYNGYRNRLDADAIADGYTSLNWVGQQNNSTASYVPTRHHEGINGDSANDKLIGAPSTNGAGNATNSISNYLGSGKPLHGVDIVMLFLCTNGEDAGTFQVNYKLLGEQIHALEPQARLVVQTGFSGSCSSQNNNMAGTGGIWNQWLSEGIPVYRAINLGNISGGDLCDTIHPTAAGYVKVGDDVYPALKAALKGADPYTAN